MRYPEPLLKVGEVLEDLASLKFAVENGIIDMEYIQSQYAIMKRKEVLKSHPYKIWQGTNELWYTYIPLGDKRKLIKKKNLKDVEDIIISYWESSYGMTFKNRFEVWVERQRNCGRSDNTIYKYRSDYKRYFENDSFENMNITAITDEDISLLIKRVLNKISIPYKSLEQLFSYLNGTFNKCIKDKIISDNPCKYVDLPIFKPLCKFVPAHTLEQRIFSKDEKEALLIKLHNQTSLSKYPIEFSIYTGMRVGELAGLKWEDINYKDRTIHIVRSEKFNQETREYFISTTKNCKSRFIPLTEDMEDVLRRARKEQMIKGCLGEFVFCNEKGQIHSRTIVEHMSNTTRTDEFNCIKGIHSLRRTLNSNMKLAGVPTLSAASILGHSPRVNDSFYTIDPSTMDEKRDFLNKAST